MAANYGLKLTARPPCTLPSSEFRSGCRAGPWQSEIQAVRDILHSMRRNQQPPRSANS